MGTARFIAPAQANRGPGGTTAESISPPSRRHKPVAVAPGRGQQCPRAHAGWPCQNQRAMSPTRRDFLKTSAATAAAIAASRGVAELGLDAQTLPAPAADPLAIELANAALDAARAGGATYADVRVGRYRRQSVATREQQVLGVGDHGSYGLGVRVLVERRRGFAA